MWNANFFNYGLDGSKIPNPIGGIFGQTVVIPVTRTDQIRAEFHQEFQTEIGLIREHLKVIEPLIAQFNESLHPKVFKALFARKAKLLGDQELVKSFGYLMHVGPTENA